MGTFSAKLRLWNPARPDRKDELELMVDTGAAFTWILRSRLEELGIQPARKMPFRRMEGHVLERDLGIAYVSSDGFSVPDLVVMAEAGEMEAIGTHTIEGLGMAADPIQKKLIPTVMPAL